MSEPRWPCPVCLGVKMDKVRIGSADGTPTLTLDHCSRCGGIWFELGEVQRLRRQRPEALRARVPVRDRKHRAQCHACRAFLDRDSPVCGSCGTKTQLACPACERPMLQVPRAGVTLDICTKCKGVWFDHHELEAIWRMERGRGAARSRGREGSPASVEALLWADPDVVFAGAAAAAHLTDSAAEAASAMPEAVAEGAGNVFESLVEVVAGIFG